MLRTGRTARTIFSRPSTAASSLPELSMRTSRSRPAAGNGASARCKRSSKLLAVGSNPPGRATRISDGYAPFASNRLFLFWLRLEFCHPLVTHVQWLRLAHLVGILLCARSFPPRGALCDHRRHLVHRSMRARPFAGAARPGGALPPVPPLPPDPKASQHGPAALFAAAAAPGPFQAPLSCGAVDS